MKFSEVTTAQRETARSWKKTSATGTDKRVSDESQIDFYEGLMYNAHGDAEHFPISHKK